MKKFLKLFATAVLLLVVCFAGFVAWQLYPHAKPQPLPESLVAIDSDRGQALLVRADARADLNALTDAYQPQSTGSFCGVASSVTVLGALGTPQSQRAFFTEEASAVRPMMSVMFGGMSLPELAGLLEAHELATRAVHAADSSLDEFRAVIQRNLRTADDYLLVNYQREVLGQGRVGHISPIGAYDTESDTVLILDTAAHKYPHTWVPVPMLFSAMDTVDGSSGKTRGYVEVLASEPRR